MTIAHSYGVLFGTSESSGVTIANNASNLSSEVDLFGADTFTGEINLFLVFTSTVTAGTMDVSLFGSRGTTLEYTNLIPLVGSYSPISGTQKIQVNPPWSRLPVSRYVKGQVLNNATGASATNVFLGYELWLYS